MTVIIWDCRINEIACGYVTKINDLEEFMKRIFLLLACVLASLFSNIALADSNVMIKENYERLKCNPPDAINRFVGSSAPGQLFMPGEIVDINLVIAKGKDSGIVKDYSVEIQEITTRDPEDISKSGYSDTAGNAPVVALAGKPVLVPLTIDFGTDDKVKEIAQTVKNFPLPARFGTYAIILVRGATRQFLATMARIPKPREYGTVDNVPVFGEGQFMNGDFVKRAQMYYRMGVRGWRSELSWSEDQNYKWSWNNYDTLFKAAEANGQKIMVTLGGHPQWTRPFFEPTPASGWTPTSGGYWGSGDWLCDPKLYQRYENWIQAFCYRYWRDGNGALWGLENYNEPWEGGGISGWARDCLQYREIQKHIAIAARTVDPRIKILAASSIMNTEDKLYSDGSNEFDKYVDIFTDHYVPPAMCYGPMVAKSKGKISMETETWFVNSEYLLPQGVAQFMASGQERIAPWHPRVLFDELPTGPEARTPGNRDNNLIPAPVVTATAAFNYFVTGKKFEKIVFKTHLPWVFQFGKDDDKDALMVMFGQLMTIGGNSPKERLWAQVDGTSGGTMTINNSDGLLQFYDLAGNQIYTKDKSVTLPMNLSPTYITCKKGPIEAAKRLQTIVINGKKPVEILPRDFTKPLTAKDVTFDVAVHNCYNRKIAGKLAITPPAEIQLAMTEQPLALEAGETKVFTFPVTKATVIDSNGYLFKFNVTSDAGNAEYSEIMNAAVAIKGTKTIDGNLDDWKDVPGIMQIAGSEKMDPTELMRRPWLTQKDKQPDGTFCEVKMAWDDNNLYIAARVNDPTPEANAVRFGARDENSYFHTKADDEKSPYKEFIEDFRRKTKDPTRSFSEVPYVFTRSPEAGIPFRRDRLQFGLDVTDDWHDLTPDTDKVPYGFHVVPDTDYEYSLYACDDGKSELWRHLAPGVPRIHDFPRQVRGKITTGAVTTAKTVVLREGNNYIYEAAIPKAELANLNLKAGTNFGFVFKIGNSKGPGIEYGTDKAVCKSNGLSLHPYWERSPSCGVRWTLVE